MIGAWAQNDWNGIRQMVEGLEDCLEYKQASASELQAYQIGLELQGLKKADASTPIMRDATVLCAPFGWSYLTEMPTNPRLLQSLKYILTSFGVQSTLLETGASGEPAFIAGFADELKQDLAIVKQHAAREEVSLEFVKAWGNVRAAYILLLFILHDLAPSEFKRAYKGDGIQSHQMWYALWVQYYETQYQLPRRKSDYSLAKFLRQIVTEERSVPDYMDKESFAEWAAKLLGDGNYLKTGFTSKTISNKRIPEYAALAEQYRSYLPPVGEEHYPLK